MKTSPAPWSLTSEDEDDLIVVDAKGGFVCAPSGDTLGQAIDNARLIAAAPELLEVAKRMAAIWDDPDRTPSELANSMDQTWVCNVIKKATS